GFNPCLIIFESIEQTNRITRMKTNLTRAEFLRTGAKTLGAAALLGSLPENTFAQTNTPVASAKPDNTKPAIFDLREFVQWIIAEFEPSVRLPGGAGNYARSPGQTTTELYGVADMACILYTL